MTGPRFLNSAAFAEPGSPPLGPRDVLRIVAELVTLGHYAQVIEICELVIHRRPAIAQAHHFLGVALHALGRPAEAIAAMRRAIHYAPKVAAYHANLGAVLRACGDWSASLAVLEEAVRLDPGHARACNDLGLVHAARRDYAQAIAGYRRALAIDPAFAEAWSNLGNAHSLTGEYDAAALAYREAITLRPHYPEAYNNLGTLLSLQGDAGAAEDAYRQALHQNPDYIDARVNLAAHCFGQGRESDALIELRDVLRRVPTHIRGLLVTARIQMQRGRHDAAEQACRAVIALHPQHVEAQVLLGQIFNDTGRNAEALALLAVMAAQAPHDAEARNAYGVALKAAGRMAEARDQFYAGLELDGPLCGFYANLSDLVDFAQDRALFGRIETAMAAQSTTAPRTSEEREQRASLHFTYAKALEDIGEHPRALDHYVAGGRLKRAALTYDNARIQEDFHRLISAFPAEVFTQRPFVGDPSQAPVFIVGMPRSGSTLVEQILASHPQVFGGGEVKYLGDALAELRGHFVFEKDFPEMLSEWAPSHYERLAWRYLADSGARAGDARRITDKLPTNYFFVGLIHLLFPRAKIIHTLRNPIDTCLSAFTKLFKEAMAHSYDLGELGQYYRGYAGLMTHWREVLPEGVMKTVIYEDLVRDPHNEVRSLLDFLDLEWSEACLDFHRSGRAVTTASAVQVRQPLYQSAINRWQKYGPGLEPLIAALGPVLAS